MEATIKGETKNLKVIICKNCKTVCEGNYCFCYHCGQSTTTCRLEVSKQLSESFFSVVMVNKGFLFTVKSLTTMPGKAIREYIQGHRVVYYPPSKYLLLIGAIVAFFSTRYHFFSGQLTSVMVSEEADTLLSSFWVYADTYTTVINILTIPVFAFFTWMFRSATYNFAENIVLNTYITAQQLLLFICMVPIFEIYATTPQYLLDFYIVVTLIYNVWVYKQFFELQSWTGVISAALILIPAYISQFLLNLLIFVLIQSLFSL
jgi:hypothetical protein